MIKLIYIPFFLLLFKVTCGQYLVIKGIVPGAEGKILELSTYDDQITYKEKKIISVPIDSIGRFNLTLSVKQPLYTFITIEYHSAELYIEPNTTYELKIHRLNYDSIYEKVNPFLEQQYLKTELLNTNDTCLNSLMGKLNSTINRFLVSYADTIYMNPSRKRVETFIHSTEKAFSSFTNSYFRSVLRYKLASLYFVSRLKSKDELIKNYFFNQSILYENTEYMDLFNNLFSNYLISGTKNIKYKDIETTINYKCNYSALLDTLGKDSILKNEVFRELVLLKNLQDFLSSKDFAKENIFKLLETMIQKTKFERHRIIAKNIIAALMKLKVTSPAPAFSLKDMNGKTYSLSDAKGKFVYLFFWKTNCLSCIAELKLINQYATKYGKKFEFIGISLDRKKETVVNFLKKNSFTWKVLFYNGDKTLIENYEAKVLPLFILIDENGDILNYPARMPSENIENTFKIFSIQTPPSQNER